MSQRCEICMKAAKLWCHDGPSLGFCVEHFVEHMFSVHGIKKEELDLTLIDKEVVP